MSGSSPGSRDAKPRHWGAWPIGLVVAVAVAVLVGMPTAGYYTYRTYDFVQHDNDFCMSCHLMADPFEAFNRSEHRGLGCKACHQPTLMGRSQMALTQILEQPEQLEQHAAVTDEVCATCHVDGDPEKWRLIANSAGHRVHLDSSDEALDEIECVSCHSTSIHEFASSDDTCAEAGCHTESEIHLGRMGDYSIGCSTCHSFRAPVGPSASVADALEELRPAASECLSCHVMREMVNLPEDDPHGGACADCHNPHGQDVAEDAASTCANVGCHDDVGAETPFHIGLTPAALADCAACHSAHDFAVDGSNCQACHGDMSSRPPGGRGQHSLGGLGLGASPNVHLTLGLQLAQEWTDRPFTHPDHTSVGCLSCHSVGTGHGTVTVRTPTDCQSCHHREPAGADCSTCHTATDDAVRSPIPVHRALELSTGDVPDREVAFEHAEHASEACVTCHEGTPFLPAVEVDCTSCHAEHHTTASDCAACHQPVATERHPIEVVHVTCAGAGCHTDPPIEGVPETRPFCLACHEEQRDHLPEQNCTACHPISGGGP